MPALSRAIQPIYHVLWSAMGQAEIVRAPFESDAPGGTPSGIRPVSLRSKRIQTGH